MKHADIAARLLGFFASLLLATQANAAALTATGELLVSSATTYSVDPQIYENYTAFQVSNPDDAKIEGAIDNGVGSGWIKSSADYGTLKTSSNIQLTLGSYSRGIIQAGGFTNWTDKIRIQSNDSSGTGFASITILALGLLDATGSPANYDSALSADATIDMVLGGYQIIAQQRDLTVGGGGRSERLLSSINRYGEPGLAVNATNTGNSIFGTYQFDLPFLFGEEFDIDIRLSANIFVSAITTELQGAYGGGDAFFDLGNSLYWGGISSITDEHGKEVAEFSVTSASGADYKKSYQPSNQNQVSEPPMLATIMLALFMTILTFKQKTRQA